MLAERHLERLQPKACKGIAVAAEEAETRRKRSEADMVTFAREIAKSPTAVGDLVF